MKIGDKVIRINGNLFDLPIGYTGWITQINKDASMAEVDCTIWHSSNNLRVVKSDTVPFDPVTTWNAAREKTQSDFIKWQLDQMPETNTDDKDAEIRIVRLSELLTNRKWDTKVYRFYTDWAVRLEWMPTGPGPEKFIYNNLWESISDDSGFFNKAYTSYFVYENDHWHHLMPDLSPVEIHDIVLKELANWRRCSYEPIELSKLIEFGHWDAKVCRFHGNHNSPSLKINPDDYTGAPLLQRVTKDKRFFEDSERISYFTYVQNTWYKIIPDMSPDEIAHELELNEDEKSTITLINEVGKHLPYDEAVRILKNTIHDRIPSHKRNKINLVDHPYCGCPYIHIVS